MYDYNINSILTEEMKNIEWQLFVKANEKLLNSLATKGLNPRFQELYNGKYNIIVQSI